MRWKTFILPSLILFCTLACSQQPEKSVIPDSPEAAKSRQGVQESQQEAEESQQYAQENQQSYLPTPIDGVWALTAIGERSFEHDLVYRFDCGRGTVEENGVEQGDGFTYRVVEGRITISGGKEEGLLDTGGSRIDSLGLEERNIQYLHYKISGNKMRWWIYSPTQDDPNRKMTFHVFKRQ